MAVNREQKVHIKILSTIYHWYLEIVEESLDFQLSFFFQDVAYALTTSLEPEHLGDLDYFVDLYSQKLSQYNIPNVDCNALRNQFDLVWLDYARVIITGLWKRFSPEQIIKNKTIVGPSYIGRSIPHAKFIIQKVHRILNEIEI